MVQWQMLQRQNFDGKIYPIDESSFVDKVNLFYNKKPASVEDGGREIWILNFAVSTTLLQQKHWKRRFSGFSVFRVFWSGFFGGLLLPDLRCTGHSEPRTPSDGCLPEGLATTSCQLYQRTRGRGPQWPGVSVLMMTMYENVTTTSDRK